MMIVSRKKYDTDIAELKEIIKNRNLEIDRKTNENALAHTELINKDSKIQKLKDKIKEAQEIDKVNSANVKDLNREINELIVSTNIEKGHLVREINRMHAMAYQVYMILFQNKKFPNQINTIQLETVLKLMTKKEEKEVVKE